VRVNRSYLYTAERRIVYAKMLFFGHNMHVYAGLSWEAGIELKFINEQEFAAETFKIRIPRHLVCFEIFLFLKGKF